MHRRGLLLKTIHCRYPDGESFLSGLRMSEGLASFRYTPERGIPPELDVGSLVSVVVQIGDERLFRVHARVIKRKPEGETRGVRFELLREEASRQELLLLAANGESIPYRRRAHVRHACAIAAELRTDDRTLMGELRDISLGGFRIQMTSELFGVGETLKVELRPQQSDALHLPARVVACIPAGPARGLCCEWSMRSSEQKRAIDAIVRAVRD